MRFVPGLAARGMRNRMNRSWTAKTFHRTGSGPFRWILFRDVGALVGAPVLRDNRPERWPDDPVSGAHPRSKRMVRRSPAGLELSLRPEQKLHLHEQRARPGFRRACPVRSPARSPCRPDCAEQPSGPLASISMRFSLLLIESRNSTDSRARPRKRRAAAP